MGKKPKGASEKTVLAPATNAQKYDPLVKNLFIIMSLVPVNLIEQQFY